MDSLIIKKDKIESGDSKCQLYDIYNKEGNIGLIIIDHKYKLKDILNGIRK